MLAFASVRARRAISHFAPEVKFVDAQYTKPFMGKAEVEAYLRECAESLPGTVLHFMIWLWHRAYIKLASTCADNTAYITQC
jgi:hypothetical protein